VGVLNGRVAIITGSGRGIGASLAYAFAREGARLVLNDLGGSADGIGADLAPVQGVADEICATGGQAVPNGGDIGDTATGEALVQTALDTYGKLDILVNCAGILRDRMIFNLTEQDWDDVIRVHLKGHFNTVRPATAYFRQQRNPQGSYRIINMSSMSGLQGSPGQPNYAAAKMGIVGLTYSLAQGLSRYGVTANAIAPSAFTRMLATVPSGKVIRKADPNSLERSPDNIAPVALYLASERSGWLTGRTLAVGGFDVALYNNPEPIRQLTSLGPWTYEQIGEQMEKSFRPVAEGLPPSIFAAQSTVTSPAAEGGVARSIAK
jgi:NAD(P)-dependent dehydrogenase (short-subunit alcohol dehydrogenase family)